MFDIPTSRQPLRHPRRTARAGRASRTLLPLVGPPHPGRPTHRSERVVGLGFRCAMVCCGATHLTPGLGADHAEAAVTTLRREIAAATLPSHLGHRFMAWGLAVAVQSARPLVVLPLDSVDFSRDEGLAVALVAAVQHPHCPALRSCAFALLGTDEIDRVLTTTAALADDLVTHGHRL
jgi:hypothetical protein